MVPLISEFGQGSLPRLPTHRNRGLEIVYIARGHLLWHTQGRIEPVPPRSVFFTLPDQDHGSAEEFEPGHEWYFVILPLAPSARAGSSFRFHPGLGFSPGEEASLFKILISARRHAAVATEAMRWVLPQLVSELRSGGSFHAAKSAGLARCAVIELARSLEADSGLEDRAIWSGPENRVRQLVSQIADDPVRDWKLPAMASKCGLGRTRFATLFQEQTGDSPIRFVNRMKIRLACQKLRNSPWSITRVAQECGFESSQYFARVFRAFTGGMCARTYREEKIPRKIKS